MCLGVLPHCAWESCLLLVFALSNIAMGGVFQRSNKLQAATTNFGDSAHGDNMTTSNVLLSRSEEYKKFTKSLGRCIAPNVFLRLTCPLPIPLMGAFGAHGMGTGDKACDLINTPVAKKKYGK